MVNTFFIHHLFTIFRIFTIRERSIDLESILTINDLPKAFKKKYSNTALLQKILYRFAASFIKNQVITMNSHFNYQEVPHGFSLCFRGECPKSENCLRHIAATHSATGGPYISIINPAHLPEDTSACTFYHTDQKVRVAWGVKDMFNKLPYEQACSIKQALVSYYGRSHYYRVYRKERYLTTKDQAYIRHVFRRYNILEEPTYEYYTEVYQW